LEHGLDPNGCKSAKEVDPFGDQDSVMQTFYSEAGQGKFVPRSFMFDLEPTVVDQMRKGSYRHLYHPDQVIDLAASFIMILTKNKSKRGSW
jgi:tubulin alpha